MNRPFRLLLLAVAAVLPAGCGNEAHEKKHREIAEWAIKQGGAVKLEDRDKQIKTVNQLPADGFVVERLNLNKTKVTDKDLKWLEKIPDLEGLDLHGTRITDKGLDYVVKLESLQILDLSNTDVTDKGLEKLEVLDELKKLFLNDTRVTQKGIDSLQSALSECKIIYITQ